MAESEEQAHLVNRRAGYPDIFPSLPVAKPNAEVLDADKGSHDSWVKRDERLVSLKMLHNIPRPTQYL
jgi:hypothetical protein